MFEVDITPDIGMYRILRSQTYDLAFALAEFIDNAIQAHKNGLSGDVYNQKKVDIEVKFFSPEYKTENLRNSIIISDNAPGMTRLQLETAMHPARESTKGHREGLNEFGIGMKSASVWLCDLWKLETRPYLGDNIYDLTFNLNEILSEGKEHIEVNEGKNQQPHGTKITLRNIRAKINRNLSEKTFEELKEIYQKFTQNDDSTVTLTAFFDDTSHGLQYKKPLPEVLNASEYVKKPNKCYEVGEKIEWKENIEFDFAGHTIKGFLMLRKTGSYVDNPGLRLFRYGRLISGTEEKPYRPQSLFGTKNKYAGQRIYGELDVTGLPVSFTKDSLALSDMDGFFEKIKNLDAYTKIKKQAENYRTSGVAKSSVDDEKEIEKEEQKKEQENKKLNERRRAEDERKLEKYNEGFLFAPDWPLPKGNATKKLREVLIEGQKLRNWGEHRVACTALLRILLELSLRHVHTIFEEKQKNGLGKLISDLNKFENINRHQQDKLREIQEILKNNNDIKMLNNALHNEFHILTEQQIKDLKAQLSTIIPYLMGIEQSN